jgi:hypothetical protein
VSGPGLGYGSLLGTPSATGLRAGDVAGVTAAGAHVSLDQAVAVGPDETIYWSALFSLDDRNNRNRFASITLHDDVTGDTLFFGEPVVGIGGLRVAASTVATGGLVSDGADAAFADGSTILLVGLYRNSATPGGDLLQLLSYDTASAIQLPGFFDPSDPNAAASFSLSGLDIDFSQITSITFDIRGTDDKFIDELRIGTTWGSVIPEPASASLLLLGLGALCGKARARRAGRRRA